MPHTNKVQKRINNIMAIFNKLISRHRSLANMNYLRFTEKNTSKKLHTPELNRDFTVVV